MYDFMHFESIWPFKMHKIIYFSRKPEKILGFIRKFGRVRLHYYSLNTDVFLPRMCFNY